VIADWCAHIAATQPGEPARQRLREAWTKARGASGPADRATIAGWVQSHADAFTAAACSRVRPGRAEARSDQPAEPAPVSPAAATPATPARPATDPARRSPPAGAARPERLLHAHICAELSVTSSGPTRAPSPFRFFRSS
jgi:hypothetical protein